MSTLEHVSPPLAIIAVFNESTRWRLPGDLVDVIARAAGDEVEVRAVASRAELTELLPDAAYLIGQPLFEDHGAIHSGRLQWLQLTSSLGDEDPLVAAALRSGTRVCTASAIRGPSVAEHAMSLLLAITRRLDLAIIAQTDQKWSPSEITPALRRLEGATLGVIATGSVGAEIIRRARPFGMRVLITRPHGPKEDDEADEHIPFPRCRSMMESCDALIVACARTPATIGLIGKSEIASMKQGAVIIDVARGGILQTGAAADAIRRGRLGGAGLDAFETEPLAPNSPLWSMPGVIITPHVASAGPGYWRTAAEVISDNLARLLGQRPLRDEMTIDWFAG